MRVGFGIDVHRFEGGGPLHVGGVVVPHDRGVEATSDGDVAIHALIDAMLGAAALGDLGAHFPSEEQRWHGTSSLDLLAHALTLLEAAGHSVVSVDITVIAQSVRVSPHREAMRTAIADVLGVETAEVSVKATTTDHVGFIGRDEGIAAVAVAMVEPVTG